MSKAMRLSEKWFQRGLWLVALAFAAFLIGLGGEVVENLSMVEEPLTVSQFVEPRAGGAAQAVLASTRKAMATADEELAQARQRLKVAQANKASVRETFDNWRATRHATARPDQDKELIERTRQLDALQAAERTAQAAVEGQELRHLDASQAHARAQAQWDVLERAATERYDKAEQLRELRVFGYRLVLTLPLLLVAVLLWRHERKGTWWPFVWGFIFFALFAFFVELVPYLPSYGGYVRYVVGILITVLVGRQAIVSLQRYLERQRNAEALPDTQRRERLSLDYDTALTRMGKGVCPGCERPVDLKDPALDFCPHCGIGLFRRCEVCTTRRNAFTRFCSVCGTRDDTSRAPA
ncbi:serine endopeptidase [Pseudoduganella chitinolytica]|uniref:Serine endopeptidase n=1 Tax=Pseudoduganella chitinolytica TaxID=34070 RepID=A0ABY8BCJ0_9BURK|nr:serine endopeptidase [Pseudoduganella chitinolytica]WEF33617.1 serine endopeptidase [Pseudoduganella chitinolytica]